MNEKVQKTIDYLKNKKKIVFVTTSNRWEDDKAKSTLLAEKIKKVLENEGVKISFFDVSKMNIFPCEGNVSTEHGNGCGNKHSMLKDQEKNPTGNHRCWASFNNKNDELWKISKELFKSEAIIFFTSVRWGQTNHYYQKLIERLTWIENRHTTLGEENIVKGINAGIIVIGHNWNGKNVLETQKQVLKYFGFEVVNELCWNWQYTDDSSDESNEGYKEDAKQFRKEFLE
jgi:multimeric flavodoxin WrbA